MISHRKKRQILELELLFIQTKLLTVLSLFNKKTLHIVQAVYSTTVVKSRNKVQL